MIYYYINKKIIYLYYIYLFIYLLFIW